MKKLTEVGMKTGTDKATYHGYTEIYEDVFSQYTSPRLLEIGVDRGQSLEMYYEYFSNPYIVAMDINKVTSARDCKLIIGDQSNPADLQRCVEGEEPFDIILDDGGHFMAQQQISFAYLFKYVKSGGYYIMEDIHTSFRSEWLSLTEHSHTTYEMLKKIENKELGFSNYIDENIQQEIIDRVDTMQFWSRVPNVFTDSFTCIMRMK